MLLYVNPTTVKYNLNFITPKIVYDTRHIDLIFNFYRFCVNVNFEDVTTKIFNTFQKCVHN